MFVELMARGEGFVWRDLTLDEAGAVRSCNKALRAALPGADDYGHSHVGLMAWWYSASAEQLRRYELRRLARAFERFLRFLGEDGVLRLWAQEEFNVPSTQIVEAVQFRLPTSTTLLPLIGGEPMVQLAVWGVEDGRMTVFAGDYMVDHFEFSPSMVDTERLDAMLRQPTMAALQFTRAWLVSAAPGIGSNGHVYGILIEDGWDLDVLDDQPLKG